ncbi:MAG: hypothetical protein ABH849_04525 [Nanoarchaeota archaeon]
MGSDIGSVLLALTIAGAGIFGVFSMTGEFGSREEKILYEHTCRGAPVRIVQDDRIFSDDRYSIELGEDNVITQGSIVSDEDKLLTVNINTYSIQDVVE